MTRSLFQDNLNAVCPYHTMFPLGFPRRILRDMKPGQVVVDPFVGRGTTLYAARERKLIGYGIDTSPVAVAISRAKIAAATPEEVLGVYDSLMKDQKNASVPTGEFWKLAFDPVTLRKVCRLREVLMGLKNADEADAVSLLRAIALGALHGPLNKGVPSYFSNQMPRTFASKPDYAVRFWSERKLNPPKVDIRKVIETRAKRALIDVPPRVQCSYIYCGDATKASSFEQLPDKIDRVVTSPPYYGMRTYEQDQWLRLWFLGGPDHINYRNPNQLSHTGKESFTKDLAKVWDRIAERASLKLKMAIRFGAIGSVKSDYPNILKQSLNFSAANWRLTTAISAGDAGNGKRQSVQMGERSRSKTIEECDFYVSLVS